MRLLAVLSFLALLSGLAMSTSSGSEPIGARADPRDYREYLGSEGVGDPSSTFIAECLAQTVISQGVFQVEMWDLPTFEFLVQECRWKGEDAGKVMLSPYASDWARLGEFEVFYDCLKVYMDKNTPFYYQSVWPTSPPRVKRQLAEAASKAIDSCQHKLPESIVHRPTLPVHEGGRPVTDATPGVAEHGVSSHPLQYRLPTTHRAALHRPLASIRKWWPALLREMRPAVQRAVAALERRPRVVEEY
ncbi:MAG: hypothetical protein M1826_005993 [Phylliscum demangeonii]|nr:MAG: hypothetical protein M1826_005993 [Phylliscum demangeonii]